MKLFKLFAIFCLIFAASAMAQTNLVVNGGFENRLNGWTQSGANKWVPYYKETTGAYADSAVVNSYKNTAHEYTLSQSIQNLEVGAKYTLLAVVKTNANSLGNLVANVATGELIFPIPSSPSQWTQMRIDDIEIGEDGQCEIRIDVACTESGKWANFDAVSFVKQGELINGSFEDGLVDALVYAWTTSGTNVSLPESKDGYVGDNSVGSWSADAHDYSLSQTIKSLDVGSKYTLRAWAKTNGSLSKMVAKVESGELDVFIPVSTDNWTEMSIEDIEIGVDGQCEISFNVVDDAGGMWISIDSVSIEKQSVVTAINEVECILSLFPNPATDLVSFNAVGIQEAKIQVFNLGGVLLYESAQQQQNTQIVLDVKNLLGSGIYIVKVKGQNTSLSQKLVVK